MPRITIEKLYFYLTSLVTLVITIILVILLANSLVRYAFPYAYDSGMPVSAIKEQIVNEKYGPIESQSELKRRAAEVTDADVDAYLERQAGSERRQTLRDMLAQLLSLAFVVPLYLFHYRRAVRISRTPEAPGEA